MKTLFSIIGHLSTATVLALAIGVVYLWQTRRITNDKMFEVVALLHDVNLDEIIGAEEAKELEVPGEETSLDDQEALREIKLRNFEVKMNSLRMSRQEFDLSFRRLTEATDRFDRLAGELETRLKEQGELSLNQNVKAVVNHLESIKPAHAKDDLLMYLRKPDGEKDVILLLKSMQDNKRSKILQQFKTEEELAELHRINELMLQGYPDKPEIDRMLERVRMPEANR